ncbi:hypothetical protein FOMA001_g2412 [Fusarium oxysporum f. sp. matthiolae]|nr:hypothetical protein FOMA001_g2412 [Fusarium oxysporum f. sp. matthiolae]
MSIDPLGATLGVLGLAGTVLDLMQYGFVAKDREDEVRVQTDKLRLESVLFHLWTEDVFLNRSWDQPHDQVKVFSPRFCKIVEDILRDIESLFKESQKFFSEDRSNNLVPLTGIDIGQPTNTATRLFQCLSRQGIHSSNPVKWAIRDAQKLDQIINDISYFRQALWAMLTPNQERLKSQVLIQSLPNQGLVTTTNSRSIENLAQTINEQNTSGAAVMELLPTTLRLRQHISSGPGAQKPLIVDAEYQEAIPKSMERWATKLKSEMFSIPWREALVEWISFGQEAIPSKSESDVAELSDLLSCLRGHPNIHLARCLGYVKDYHVDGLRFGLILHLPALHDLSRHTTLHKAIESVSRPQPELDCRFRLALSLSQSIFQLLCSGWFHKGICSHNVLLNPLAKAQGQDYVDDLTGSTLVGFEFARLNHPSKPSRKPCKTQGWDLFRHPRAVSSRWTSEEYLQRGYVIEYDIYSLGVMLAELGLWRTAYSLERSAREKVEHPRSPDGKLLPTAGVWKDEDFAPDLLRRIKCELPGLVGKRFTKVVQWCLSVQPTDRVSQAERLAEMEEKVLAELGKVQV